MLRKIINKSQRLRNNEYINKSNNTTKATWNIINSNKYKLPKESIKEIKYINTTLNTPQEIAEAFNNTFIGLVENHINNTNYNSKHKINIEKTTQSLFMNPTTPHGIVKIISTLKNKASVRYDEICTKVIKYCSLQIAKPLCHIINLSTKACV